MAAALDQKLEDIVASAIGEREAITTVEWKIIFLRAVRKATLPVEAVVGAATRSIAETTCHSMLGEAAERNAVDLSRVLGGNPPRWEGRTENTKFVSVGSTSYPFTT
jgi:hypothetical protein